MEHFALLGSPASLITIFNLLSLQKQFLKFFIDLCFQNTETMVTEASKDKEISIEDSDVSTLFLIP